MPPVLSLQRPPSLRPVDLLAATLAAAACGSPAQPSVTRIPAQLSVTQFLAFGDSITAGEVPTPGAFGLQLRVVEPSKSYPAQLQTLLLMRYAPQAIQVANDGVPGEAATAGAIRLPRDLARYHPDVLLLLEGANDLDALGSGGVQPALDALRSMIRTARANGKPVARAFATAIEETFGSSSTARAAAPHGHH